MEGQSNAAGAQPNGAAPKAQTATNTSVLKALPQSKPAQGAQAQAETETQAQKVEQPNTAAEGRHVITIDGEEVTLTTAELIRDAQKARFANKAITQAKHALRAYQQEKAEEAQRLEAGKKNPAELLKRAGIDPDEFARAILAKKMQEAELTPEERRIQELEAENETHKQERQRAAEEKKSQRISAAAKQRQAQMLKELTAAAEKVGVPRDQDGFYAVYEAVAEFQKAGLPFDAERIAEVARENIDGGFKRLESAVLKGLKGKALVDRLGPEVVKEVLRFKVEEVRGGGGKRPAVTMQNTQKQAQASPYITPDEAKEQIRKLGQGKR